MSSASSAPSELSSAAAEPSELSLRRQLLRFVITGGLSAVVDFGLLNALMLLAGWPHPLAKSASFVAGTTTAYLINRRWTFQAAPSKARFVAVVVLYGVTFALQVGIYTLLFNALQPTAWSVPAMNAVAFVIAQGIATTVNFVVHRAVIFKRS